MSYKRQLFHYHVNDYLCELTLNARKLPIIPTHEEAVRIHDSMQQIAG